MKETGEAKHSGHNWSNRRRAEQQGGTWYRGAWHSASSLRAQPLTVAGNQEETTVKSPPRCRILPRLQIVTYNVGGFTPEKYEVFKDWLEHRCKADVVVVQETHWGGSGKR